MAAASDELIEFYCRISDAGIPCLIGGSVGTIAFGEPRATLDIDLVVDLHEADIPRLIAAFPSDRFYLPDATVLRQESRRRSGHVNIIDVATGLKADLYFPVGDPLQAYGRAHAVLVNLGGVDVQVAPPTYLIAMKLRYYAMSQQDKHLRDIRGMLMLSGDLVDHAVVEHWARVSGTEAAWADCLARPGEE